MAYGAMASYLMIVKQVFSTVLGVDDDPMQRRAVLLIISLAIMVPISSKRDMADLSFTSRLSVIIDTILVALVIYNAPISDSLEVVGGWGGMLDHAVHWDTMFVGLGVLSFAFVCQHSAFIIAGSLDRPTIARWSIVTRNALCFCVCLALTCGICGYTGYLESTNGNILSNLDPTSWSANAARGMLGTTMLFVYPLESFVARHVCMVLVFQGRRAHDGEDATVLNRRDRRITLTFILYLTAVIPAALFDDLGSVLAIAGAIGGSCLSYIGPGAVYLGVHGGSFLELVRQSWLRRMLEDEPKSSIPSDDNARTKESTPLLQRTDDAEKGITPSKQDDHQTEEVKDSLLARLFRVPVWYLTGMPLWCAIAGLGEGGVHQHAEEMALKSPHPIRIGSVIYRRKESTGSIHDKSTIERLDSFPFAAGSGIVNSARFVKSVSAMSESSSRPEGNINRLLGQEILRQQQEARKAPQQHSERLEADPQAQPPTWYDFVVAIFFILFGCLALVAGLVSLAHGE
jgi:sodium-coupled neutral amino acid transporter 11